MKCHKLSTVKCSRSYSSSSSSSSIDSDSADIYEWQLKPRCRRSTGRTRAALKRTSTHQYRRCDNRKSGNVARISLFFSELFQQSYWVRTVRTCPSIASILLLLAPADFAVISAVEYTCSFFFCSRRNEIENQRTRRHSLHVDLTFAYAIWDHCGLKIGEGEFWQCLTHPRTASHLSDAR